MVEEFQSFPGWEDRSGHQAAEEAGPSRIGSCYFGRSRHEMDHREYSWLPGDECTLPLTCSPVRDSVMRLVTPLLSIAEKL